VNWFKYRPGESWSHRLDPRVKFLFIVLFSAVSILFESPGIQLGLFGGAFFLFLSLRTPWTDLRPLVLVYYPVTLLVIGVSQGFFHGNGGGGTFAFYAEGFFYGLIQALRVLAISTAGLWVILSTAPTSLLYALRRIGFPYEICFIGTLALRLVPIIFQETRLNLMAQRARGFDYRRFSLRGKLAALMRAGETVFINSIHSARDTALAVDLRAFRVYAERTFTDDVPMNKLSWFILSLILAGFLFALVAYGMGWGKYLI